MFRSPLVHVLQEVVVRVQEVRSGTPSRVRGRPEIVLAALPHNPQALLLQDLHRLDLVSLEDGRNRSRVHPRLHLVRELNVELLDNRTNKLLLRVCDQVLELRHLPDRDLDPVVVHGDLVHHLVALLLEDVRQLVPANRRAFASSRQHRIVHHLHKRLARLTDSLAFVTPPRSWSFRQIVDIGIRQKRHDRFGRPFCLPTSVHCNHVLDQVDPRLSIIQFSVGQHGKPHTAFATADVDLHPLLSVLVVLRITLSSPMLLRPTHEARAGRSGTGHPRSLHVSRSVRIPLHLHLVNVGESVRQLLEDRRLPTHDRQLNGLYLSIRILVVQPTPRRNLRRWGR